MSLEETADQLAGHLKRQEFVEVYAHHDADGIAAASILCMAMARNEVHFRLRIRDRISPAHVSPDTPTLLCDFGSGLEDLPPEVMVVDHHLPHFQGGLHVNPRLFGIDGDRELSAAGAAYLVARAMGDNRDLSGLVMLGILGDGQELTGQNLEIFNEGAAEGIITNRRGLRLAGRDDHERLSLAVNPYLHQISGDEMAVADLIESSMTDDGMALDTLLSLVILRIGPYATERAMTSVYGDRLILEREVIPDAHSLTAVVDACGKQGQGGLAASLCMRNTDGIAAGWALTLEHRNGVIRTLREFGCTGDSETGFSWWESPGWQAMSPMPLHGTASAKARSSWWHGRTNSAISRPAAPRAPGRTSVKRCGTRRSSVKGSAEATTPGRGQPSPAPGWTSSGTTWQR